MLGPPSNMPGGGRPLAFGSGLLSVVDTVGDGGGQGRPLGDMGGRCSLREDAGLTGLRAERKDVRDLRDSTGERSTGETPPGAEEHAELRWLRSAPCCVTSSGVGRPLRAERLPAMPEARLPATWATREVRGDAELCVASACPWACCCWYSWSCFATCCARSAAGAPSVGMLLRRSAATAPAAPNAATALAAVSARLRASARSRLSFCIWTNSLRSRDSVWERSVTVKRARTLDRGGASLPMLRALLLIVSANSSNETSPTLPLS
mmetsp:Transcript_14721/g.44926  ORF Transcript_14721/g.44926 Transcript_14721/m.44926 type:complete len:265 (+) Transcript_14721:457-1251(+)